MSDVNDRKPLATGWIWAFAICLLTSIGFGISYALQDMWDDVLLYGMAALIFVFRLLQWRAAAYVMISITLITLVVLMRREAMDFWWMPLVLLCVEWIIYFDLWQAWKQRRLDRKSDKNPVN